MKTDPIKCKTVFLIKTVQFSFYLFTSICLSQPVQKSLTISPTVSQYSKSIILGGLLDGTNTLTKKFNPTKNVYFFERVFEPMTSLKIANTGLNIIEKPRLEINNKKKWYNHYTIASEATLNAVNTSEKVYSIWNFIKENRVWYSSPERTRENSQITKTMGIYGFGICSDIAASVNNISFYSSISSRVWWMAGHVVSEVKVGDRWWIVDSDLENIYLGYDNKTPMGKQELTNDRYLIYRSHHNGKAENDEKITTQFPLQNNLGLSKFVSLIYDTSDYAIQWNFATGHELYYSLRPDESITYLYEPAKKVHWNNGGVNDKNLSDLGTISNGFFQWKSDFRKSNLSLIFETTNNIGIDSSDSQNPVLTAKSNQGGSIVFKVKSPYVLVDGGIKLSYTKELQDSISVQFSKDGINWDYLWSANQSVGSDSIGLYNFIKTKSSPALYQYYLKFIIDPSTNYENCSISLINSKSIFQVTKNFLPAFTLGNNNLKYSDSNTNGRNVKIDISWKESSTNTPPENNIVPVYPENQSDSDSLQFTFHWTKPSDADGDDIDLYEIELSTTSDMKFQMSANFERYIYPINGKLKPEYRIPFPGLLNAETTYYWRVKAKDSKGAWGNWSSIFSFQANGVMPPEKISSTISDSAVILRWKSNSSGIKPSRYDIHHSNESNGFIPTESTFLASSESDSIVLKYLDNKFPKLYYRIIAVGANNDKSGPSEYFKIPENYIYSIPPKLVPDKNFHFRLGINTSFYPVWKVDDIDTLSSAASVSILQKPDWLDFDYQTNTFSVFADSSTVKKLFYNPESGFISLKTSSVNSSDNYQNFNLKSEYQNKPPVFSGKIISVFANDSLNLKVPVSDPDLEFGDSLKISIIEKPDWVEIDERMFIVGIPDSTDIGIQKLVLSVHDSQNSFLADTIFIEVKRVNKLPLLMGLNKNSGWEDSLFVSKILSVNPDSIYSEVLKFALLKNPVWMKIDSVTGVINGTPKDRDVGIDTLLIQANDGYGGISVKKEIVEIFHVNHDPQIFSKPDSIIYEDSFFSYSPLALDQDTLFSDILNYKIIEIPKWIKFDYPTSRFSGNPKGRDVGNHLIKYEVTDGKGGKKIQIDKLKVIHVNHLPVITSNPDSLVFEDSEYKYQISVTDMDSLFDDIISIHPVELPSWLFFDETTKLLSGIPKGANVGLNKVKFRVDDNNQGIAIQEFNLEVIHVNHLPEFHSQPDTIANEDQLYNYQISISDKDSVLYNNRIKENYDIHSIKKDQLSLKLIKTPSWLSLNKETASITGIPKGKDVGDTLAVIEINDGNGGIVYQSWNLKINHVNHSPYFKSNPNTIAVADSFYSYLIIADDSDKTLFGDSISISLLQSPDWISFDRKQNTLSGSVPIIPVKKYPIKLKIYDNSGLTEYQEFEILTVEKKGSDFKLLQNFPNPFNSSTFIRFNVTRKSKVQIFIYNTIGQKVGSILDEEKEVGFHNVLFNTDLASGVYYYTIIVKAGNEIPIIQTKKMILLK